MSISPSRERSAPLHERVSPVWLNLTHGSLAEALLSGSSALSAVERVHLKRSCTLRLPRGDERCERLTERGFKVEPYQPKGVIALALARELTPQHPLLGLPLSLSAHPLSASWRPHQERAALSSLYELSATSARAARLELLTRSPQLSLSALWVEPRALWGALLELPISQDKSAALQEIVMSSLKREGESAGLAFALACLWLYVGAEGRDGCVAASATLSSSGHVGPVEGLEVKLQGLYESGVRPNLTLISREQPALDELLEGELAKALNVSAVGTLSEAAALCLPDALKGLSHLSSLSPVSAAREALLLEASQEHQSALLMVQAALKQSAHQDAAHRLEIEVTHDIIQSTLALYAGDTHESERFCEVMSERLALASPQLKLAALNSELMSLSLLRRASTLCSLYRLDEAIALSAEVLVSPPSVRACLEALGVKARALRLKGLFDEASEALKAQRALYLPPELLGERARCWLNTALLSMSALSSPSKERTPHVWREGWREVGELLKLAFEASSLSDQGRHLQTHRHGRSLAWRAYAALAAPDAPLRVWELTAPSSPSAHVLLTSAQLLGLPEREALFDELKALLKGEGSDPISARVTLSLALRVIPQLGEPLSLLVWWRRLSPHLRLSDPKHHALNAQLLSLEAPLLSALTELQRGLRSYPSPSWGSALRDALSQQPTPSHLEQLSRDLSALGTAKGLTCYELSIISELLSELLSELTSSSWRPPQRYPELIMSHHHLTLSELWRERGELELAHMCCALFERELSGWREHAQEYVLSAQRQTPHPLERAQAWSARFCY